jgi:thioredoxin reductase
MHGYLSLDGLPPAELLEMGRAEVRQYGGEVITDTVEHAWRQANRFVVELSSGRMLQARRLVVTTGLRDVLPNVPRLHERWARDVLHCPYCHGWEVKDRRIGVLANGSQESVTYTHIVRQWSQDVIVFVPPESLTGDQLTGLNARGIRVVDQEVVDLVVENDHLTAITIADGQVVPREVLFVPPRFEPNSGLLVELGCELDERGHVTVDATGLTTQPGVWVAGNVSNPRAQVITAAGEGSAVAIALNADLVSEDVRLAVAHYTEQPEESQS